MRPTLVKFSANVIDSHLTYIFNCDIAFSLTLTQPLVRPTFKKKDRANIENYGPVSILISFSKIYKRFLYDQLTVYKDGISSDFMTAYRKRQYKPCAYKTD